MEEVLLKKICSACKVEKNLELFNIDRKAKFGKRCYCKSCDKKKRLEVKEYHKIRQKKWRENNLEKHRSDVRFHSYTKLGLNITKEQYSDLLKSQNGLCAICNNPPKEGTSLCLDHDHTTNKIRGFLCRDCNLALGKFKDCYNNLINAAEYLLMNK